MSPAMEVKILNNSFLRFVHDESRGRDSLVRGYTRTSQAVELAMCLYCFRVNFVHEERTKNGLNRRGMHHNEPCFERKVAFV